MKKLGVINGLRGFAILAVIYHHLFSRFTRPGFESIDFGEVTLLPYTLLANGWLGVNLFFILSGFVLAYPYFLGKRDLRTSTDIRNFYLHRAKRLLPLYYFSVVICIVFVVPFVPAKQFTEEAILLGGVIFNFTMHMWSPRQNWVLWSLGIEIWFSILFPLIILAITRFGILRVLVAVLSLSLITRIIGNSPVFDIGNIYLNPVRDSLLGRLDDFLMGMFVCNLYVNRANTSWKCNPLVSFALGLILIFIACSTWDYIVLGIFPRGIIPFINIVLDLGFCTLLMSLLIIKNGWVKNIFDNYIVQLFGVMCYSLYIWHGISRLYLVRVYDTAHVATYLAVLFFLAALSYRYIEFGHIADSRALFLFDTRHQNSNSPRAETKP